MASADFPAVFSSLKPIFRNVVRRLSVKTDTAREYTVVTRKASPFPQHKGEPMFFGSVRLGKAYVSFHLMSLYMTPALTAGMSAALKRRMQGKTCFNFTGTPDPELIAELESLTKAGLDLWVERGWA